MREYGELRSGERDETWAVVGRVVWSSSSSVAAAWHQRAKWPGAELGLVVAVDADGARQSVDRHSRCGRAGGAFVGVHALPKTVRFADRVLPETEGSVLGAACVDLAVRAELNAMYRTKVAFERL